MTRLNRVFSAYLKVRDLSVELLSLSKMMRVSNVKHGLSSEAAQYRDESNKRHSFKYYHLVVSSSF